MLVLKMCDMCILCDILNLLLYCFIFNFLLVDFLLFFDFLLVVFEVYCIWIWEVRVMKNGCYD